jgi:hypothetical protein
LPAEEAGSHLQALFQPFDPRGISILIPFTFYSNFVLFPATSLALSVSLLEEEGFAFGDPLDEGEEHEVEDFLGEENSSDSDGGDRKRDIK